ncbi:MAG: endonuclease III [Burkholderiales bacterium]|nr:endonuclease III [Anaerolineae bacterium]
MAKQSFNAIEHVDDFERRRAKYQPVSKGLHEVYGTVRWHTDNTGVDMLVECILSQSTSDLNSGRAFAALKARYPGWEQAAAAPIEELIETIRSAGLANQKAPVIQEALHRIYTERGGYDIDFLNDMPLDEAKAWLTAMRGVGPKTAAIVLCFSYNRPAFPVDTHVHRVGQRIGFLPKGISADRAHDVMEAMIPPQAHYDFHITLIRHGREICLARRPQCERCPITAYCDYYREQHDWSNPTQRD